MNFEVWLVVIILRLVDIIIQSTGLYLLTVSLHDDEHNKPLHERNIQPLYIINLTISELTFSLLWMLVLPTQLAHETHSYYEYNVQPIIILVIMSGVQLAYFATMFCITLDRLIAVKLSVKYGVYWNWKRAKHMIIVIWVISALFAITSVIINRVTGEKLVGPYSTYLFTPLNFIFLLLAVFTYSFIFHQYKRSLMMVLKRDDVKLLGEVPDNACVMFLKSKFKITLMIIVTFIIFQGIPTISHTFTSLNTEYDPMESVRAILYPIGNISDCCIYIFFQPKIRRIFWRKLHRLYYGGNKLPSTKKSKPKENLLSIKMIQEEIMNHNFTVTSIQAIHDELMIMHMEDAALQVIVPNTRMNMMSPRMPRSDQNEAVISEGDSSFVFNRF